MNERVISLDDIFPNKNKARTEQNENKEIIETLRHISKELADAKTRDAKMMDKIDAIQDRLEEISRTQLLSIINGVEKLAKTMNSTSNTKVIQVAQEGIEQILTSIDKEELHDMIDDAFTKEGNSIKYEIRQGFDKVYSDLELSHNIQLKDNKNLGYSVLGQIQDLRERIDSIGSRTAEMSTQVNALRSGGGLY